jgi:hypothetical protein
MKDLTKTDGATFDNDAKACFDRIILSLTNLRSRQLGFPRSACQLHADLLLKVDYVLTTAVGIFEQTEFTAKGGDLTGPSRHGLSLAR